MVWLNRMPRTHINRKVCRYTNLLLDFMRISNKYHFYFYKRKTVQFSTRSNKVLLTIYVHLKRRWRFCGSVQIENRWFLRGAKLPNRLHKSSNKNRVEMRCCCFDSSKKYEGSKNVDRPLPLLFTFVPPQIDFKHLARSLILFHFIFLGAWVNKKNIFSVKISMQIDQSKYLSFCLHLRFGFGNKCCVFRTYFTHPPRLLFTHTQWEQTENQFFCFIVLRSAKASRKEFYLEWERDKS